MSRISYRVTENGTDHFEIYFEDLIQDTQSKLLQFINDNGGDISKFKLGLPLCQFHSDPTNIAGYKDFNNVIDSDIDQGEPFSK